MSQESNKWEIIRKDYEKNKPTLKELAKKHGVKLGTLKSRKSRENWESGKVATKNKKLQPKKKKVATEEPKLVIENDELNDNQKLFCILYLQYKFNGTKAYQEAYDVNYTTAMAASSRLLSNVKIKAEIHQLKAKLQHDIYISVQDILHEYIKQIFVDIKDFLDFGTEREKVLVESGNLDPLTGEPQLEEKEVVRNYLRFKPSEDVDGTLISEVRQGRDGVSVKMFDKQRAMEQLLKYIHVDDLTAARIVKAEAEGLLAKAESDKIAGNEDTNKLLKALYDVFPTDLESEVEENANNGDDGGRTTSVQSEADRNNTE